MDRKQYFVGLQKRNVELNAALERLLGIDLKTVHSVTIYLAADEAARVVVERFMDDMQAAAECVNALPTLAPVVTAKSEYVEYVKTDAPKGEGAA